jgi:hypothetical protein|tara:strand:+ start:809 stop:1294 length:486 start_codon:yes stop_codon:yes gene_type:complete
MLDKNQANKIKLQQRKDRYEYMGLLTEYQLVMNTGSFVEYTKLNPKQHFIFKRVLHGLKMYNEAEIAKMHWDKKRRVIKVWKRGQEVINELKQWVAYKQVQPIFRIFAKSELGRAIYESEFEYLPDYRNKHTLKDLGLNYSDLILKFMSVGLVPKNFYSLK